MKKLLHKFFVLLPLIALMLSTNQANAQRPYAPMDEADFEIRMENIVQIEDNILEFDLHIFDTDPTQGLEIATCQFAINYNIDMLDGGSITNILNVPGSSQVYPGAYPNANAAIPGILRITGNATLLGCDGQPLMSTELPGSRVMTVRLTNSVPFAANSTPNFTFRDNTAPTYGTKFAFYAASDCYNTQCAVTGGENANVYGNPVLNPAATCEDPIAYNVTGTGEYCNVPGSVGMPVGLDGSQIGVDYTLNPGGVVVAGTGSAITFGNQLAGTYTVTALSDGSNPDICTEVVDMEGEAVITATEPEVSTVTIAADANPVCAGTTVTFTATASNEGTEPLYEWFVNGGIPPAFTGNPFSYVPENGDNVHVTLTPGYLCTLPVTSDPIVMVVNENNTQEFTEAACDSFIWSINGETYTESGDYTFVEECVTYILHLTITESTTVEFTVAACDSYTWALNGETYTESGDYTFVDGCVTNILHLTITPSGTNEYTVSACDEYLWAISGETYTESGTYEFINGCSTNILYLTIIESSIEEFTQAACDEYTWAINGETYTESGDYTFVDGCVTYILHLTITPSGTNEFTVSACDSYFWALNGMTYTESGVYTFENGCSTNILTLTITASTTEEFTESACDTYTWALNGETYTESGDYEYVVECVTNILHLTITPSTIEEFTVTAVESYTWDINGETYTESGDYTFVEGCITYILHLTITTVPCPDFSTWNGSVSSDWFTVANWTPEALPCETTVVTIPGGCPNYPTLVTELIPTAVDCYVTIAGLTINDGGSLIGQEYLCVNSDVVVERSIVNQLFHLIGSPVDDVTFGDVFLPEYWFDVWAREYNEATGDWENRFIADHLAVGLGYSVQMNIAPQTATFTGDLNSVDVTRTLSNVNPGSEVNRVGWNLLGNPFPSAIDWDAFSTGDYDAQVAVWDEAVAGNYIYWNGSVGSLTDGIIPAQNGFFVKTETNGASITIPLAAQVHSPQVLYKNAVSNALELRADGNNYYDATYVHFNDYATASFDSNYDAFKLDGLETAPQLYTIADYKLSINELPFEGNEIVKVGFTCGDAGTYTVTASGMESFSGSTPILLEDRKLNLFQDLRLNPSYSFNYQPGDNENRFNLHFKSSTGIVDGINSGISVYSYDHTVIITNTTGLAGDVRIYDLAGRELLNTSIGSSTTTRIPMQVAIGTYVVKVINSSGTVNQKVFIH